MTKRKSQARQLVADASPKTDAAPKKTIDSADLLHEIRSMSARALREDLANQIALF
jgi:hypothetical protein